MRPHTTVTTDTEGGDSFRWEQGLGRDAQGCQGNSSVEGKLGATDWAKQEYRARKRESQVEEA